MKKSFYLLIAFICVSVIAMAQQGGSVKGKLVDTSAKQPLSEATVSVISSKDSSLVSYTISDKKGFFEIKDLDPGDYRLLVSYQGFQTYKKSFSITAEKQIVDLAEIKMEAEYKALGEVIITDDAPIKIKKDTIEFKADAFKTKPNATVEDLLKKVPGTQVDKEGNIKVQGEAVPKVYVDGKEFFGNDPKLATKNLTADMVESIQVFDDMSEQAKFSKIDDGSRQKAINIKLKKDKKRGYFARALAGIGSEGRFETNLSANNFKGERQISLLANINNINKQGFSFSDVASAMGLQGLKNAVSGGGGSSGGITRSISTGLNFNDVIGAKIKVGGSYFYSNSKSRSERDVFRQTFFDNDSTTELTDSYNSNNTNQNHRFNIRFEYQIDSMNSILYTPSFTLQNSDGISSDTSYTNSLLPGKERYLSITGKTMNTNERKGLNLGNNLLFRHRFKKIGRTLTVGWSNTYGESNSEGVNISHNVFYDSSGNIDRIINQDNNTLQESFNHGNVVSTSYTEPLGKDKLVELNYAYTRNSSTSDRKTYSFDPTTGKYSVLNLPLTNYFENLFEANRFGFNFRVQKKKYNYQIGSGVQISTQKSLSHRAVTGKDSLSEQKYKNFFPVATFNYQPTRAKSIRFNYRGRTNQPSVTQLQNVLDISNPLVARIGNPDLRQEFNHNLGLGYNTFNAMTFRFFSFNINYSTTSNKIVNSTDTLEKGVQLIKPVNVNGAFNTSAFLTVGLPFKNKKLRGSSVNFTTTGSYNKDVSVLYKEENIGKTLTLTQGVGVNLNLLKDKIIIGLNMNVTYSNVKYSVNTSLNEDYFSQTYSADVAYTLPKNFIISADFDYFVNSGRANGFNQSIPLLNAGIAKQVFKKKNGEIRFTVNDIMNQNQSITRSAVDNYIEDVRSMILRRYFMLSFLFNLNRMGGKNINPLNALPIPGGMKKQIENIRIN